MSSASKMSSTFNSAGSGLEESQKKDSSSREEPTNVAYEPPPASWFFARGKTGDSNQSKQTMNSQNNSSEFPKDRKVSASSSPPVKTQEHHNNVAVHFPPNVDAGMVSDNEGDDEEHEGFNFIAISNSLLMAGRSFEHLSTEDADHQSRSSSDKQGVLIVDGIASDGSENESSAIPSNHNQDASVLTVPGSDSLPSDIASICHHDDEEDEDDPLFGDHPAADEVVEQGSEERRDILEDVDSNNQQPLVHRYLKYLQRTRRLRKVSDASDACDVSIVRHEDDDMSMATVETQVDRFRRGLLNMVYGGRFLPVVLIAFTMVTTFVCHSFVKNEREQREASELRLQQQEKANLRMMDENLSLLQEIELLMEEAAVAAARAESLARDQERLLLEREAADKAEKERLLLLQEQEERKQQERENQKRRRKQPWRSNDENFGWFFDDSNEECSSPDEDGSSTFTIADNCWIKAKADINLGNCGGETRDLFSSFWNGLWEDWDYYFDYGDSVESYPNENNDQSGNPSKEVDHGYYQIGSGDDEEERKDEDHRYEYQDDTYYPPQDPLQDLFSVIHAAGESFVNKLSNLMGEEVESTQKAAREMYAEASDSVVNAMEIAKDDMRELSREALLAIRTAVQKSNTATDGAQPTQPVTRKGLYDAATAVAALSKSWQEYAKSLSVVGEGTEQ